VSRLRRLVLLWLALLLLACAANPLAARRPTPAPKPPRGVRAAPSRPTAAPAAASYQPRFTPAGCPFDTAGEPVECGYLIVPENRAEPDGAEVRVAVAIIRSVAANAASDPVVYLEGGPGGSALYDAAYWFSSPFRRRRDIILVDQRGTGYSLPSLNCPELEAEDIVTVKDQLHAARACSRRLRRSGVDLRQYNSAAIAADIADLRVALGLRQINLFGVSYGTRAALTVLRDHPEGIRSVILDSAYPPQVDAYSEEGANAGAAIEALLQGCAADPACAEAYPQLDRTFYRLVARLNRAPATIERVDAGTGEPYEEELYGDDLVSHVVGLLYDTAAIPRLPRAIAEAAEGDYGLLAELLDGPPEEEPGDEAPAGEQLAPEPARAADAMGSSAADAGDISYSEGVFYSVECHEEVIFGDLEAAERAVAELPRELHTALLSPFEQTTAICDVWGAGRAGAREELPVASDVPALVLAGEYDPITPPRWGRAAAEHLPNSYFFEFPGIGHAAVFAHSCPERIALAFLDRPRSEPPATCLARMRGPQFEVP